MHPSIDQPVARIDGVRVYLCRIGTDADLSATAGWAWLSDEERRRASRFRYARDRNRWVRSVGFLRHILGAATGQPPAGLQFHRTAGGKPHLAAGGPLFNLSHSAMMAALAVSDAGSVGIDIEEPGRLPETPGGFDTLAETCFRPDEIAAIRTSQDPRQVFLRFWTAKEARMKLTGEGLTLEPLSIALSHQGGQPTGYILPASPMATLHMLDVGPAVVALARGAAALHLQC